MITPAAAIADPALLGPAFASESWDTWRAVLRGAFGEPLSDAERSLFSTVAGDRDPPPRQVRELWVIAGRRSGKDSIASAVATTVALSDHRQHLRPGERASVLCLAVDRDQARIVSRYIAGYFREIPLLRPLVVRETDDGLELTNGVEIVVSTNSYRAVRGRTILCAIFDEVAFWRSEDYANPDQEVYSAVLPGLVTLPGALLVGITTAYRRGGLAYQKWHKHFGRDDPEVLVVYGPSTAFNPTLPQHVIDAALSRDPEAAGAEWLSQWRTDISDFFDRELVQSAVDHGVVVRPPQPGIAYRVFCDPSGGRGDAFTAAVAHAEANGAVVLDALYERRPPFDPSGVVGEIAALARGYGVGEVTGDRYAAQWVVEAFSREGIAYRQSERDRSAIYLDALPLFTAGRAHLLDHPRLLHQLVSLERRTARGGRDRVDHPPGGADDLANAAAGALVLAASAAAPALWRQDALLRDGAALSWPRRLSVLFASAAADHAGVFVCFWGMGDDRYDQDGARCLLVDFQRSPFAPSLFDTVRDRLEAFAAECEASDPRGLPKAGIVVTVPALLPFATAAGFATRDMSFALAPGARDGLVISCAAAIGRGMVKIAAPAEQRSRSLPLPLAAIRPDAPADAAADAALLGIAATLPDEQQPAAWRQ